MFARFLLLIVVLTGLAAGPALPRELCWVNAVAGGCECCGVKSAAPCCAVETTPSERTPLPAVSSTASDLKLALQPIVALLPRVFVIEQTKVRTVAAMSVAPPEGVQIDRLCIRLI